jgi:hypothetical protein
MIKWPAVKAGAPITKALACFKQTRVGKAKSRIPIAVEAGPERTTTFEKS